MRYAIVIEWADGNCSACVPALPGCVSTGRTVADVPTNISQAIAFHLDGLREDGAPIPPASSQVEYVHLQGAA